ncbi:hypothetical protein LTR27_002911 [Elasticomyces elasticus]|nr:hypothetical protein LTR27_002911 [Elasticomyces elasticus]
MNSSRTPTITPRLDSVPVIQLMAASWAGLIREGKTTAAETIEKAGKMVYGDQEFQAVMAEASGGSGVVENEGEGGGR